MPTPDRLKSLRTGTYKDISREYYDRAQHPTCANFREASTAILVPWLSKFAKQGMQIIEVGAGASIVSDWLAVERREINGFVASDLYLQMLQYSREPIPPKRVVCDAQCLPFVSACFDVLVASLGDPYNTRSFWTESARVLRAGGYILFTTPSSEWALQFRGSSEDAEFLLRGGDRIAVPSFVMPEARQLEMIQACGLEVIDIRSFEDRQILEALRSPALRPGPIVSGYLVQRVE
jgi:ubiquinone/menaquinone biosynthesis C-methylase UbiE